MNASLDYLNKHQSMCWSRPSEHKYEETMFESLEKCMTCSANNKTYSYLNENFLKLLSDTCKTVHWHFSFFFSQIAL